MNTANQNLMNHLHQYGDKLDREGDWICPFCGTRGYGKKDWWCSMHRHFHQFAIDLKSVYGKAVYNDWKNSENFKWRLRRDIRTRHGSVKHQVMCVKELLMLYFVRSASWYRLKEHPTYQEYCAMQLSFGPDDCLDMKMSKEVYDILVSEFGTSWPTKKGYIKPGGSRWFKI